MTVLAVVGWITCTICVAGLLFAVCSWIDTKGGS